MFTRHFYPKRLSLHSRYTCILSESNPWLWHCTKSTKKIIFVPKYYNRWTKKSLKSCMNCCSQFEFMGHIHKIIKSYCDLNTHWFLITLLSFNMKHCENEAGPSCALAVSEKIPAGSTHASVRPYGPNTLWAPLKEKSMTAESQTLHLLSNKTTRERESLSPLICLALIYASTCNNKSFQKRICQSINQSMLLLLKYSHERVKVQGSRFKFFIIRHIHNHTGYNQ